MEITKDQFDRYVAVQESGVTNMWDAKMVSQLSGLNEGEILHIIKNYSQLASQYKDKPTS